MHDLNTPDKLIQLATTYWKPTMNQAQKCLLSWGFYLWSRENKNIEK